MTEHDERLDRLLDQWTPPRPGPGFASAAVAEFRRRRTARSRTKIGVCLGACAAVLGLVLVWPRGDAPRLLEIATDDRGLVAPEPGAEVTRRSDGRVDHRRGVAIYRADAHVIAVASPTAHIEGSHALFEVEVQHMSQRSWKSGSAGALLGVVTLVTVYEGKVVVASEGERIEVGAGERATTEPGNAPRIVDASEPRHGTDAAGAPPSSSAVHAEAIAALRLEHATTLDRIAELRAQLERTEAGDAPPLERCIAQPKLAGCRFSIDSPDLKLAMAECGAIRVDFPDRFRFPEGPVFSDAWLQRVGIVGDDAEALQDLGNAFKERWKDRLREFAVQCGVSAEAAAETEEFGLHALVDEHCDNTNKNQIIERIARERAGLQTPPPLEEQSVEDRYWRALASAGDELEASIAARLGDDRAHALRAHQDGWGPGFHFPGRCRPKTP